MSGPDWEHDDYRQPLPREQPGAPAAGGSWEIAVDLSRSYAFADPSLVEAHYHPDVPLEGREMLLILHALGARIYAGVRVGGVRDERRTEERREAQVFAWNYRTLEGHVESGQRDFEVWKWLDSGEVEFRTHAVSRPAEANVLVRVGFRLLGRHKQVEFGRRACARMALLTEARLQQPDDEPKTLDGRMLALYLRDHHALLVAVRELAGRMSRGGRDDAPFAERVREAAEDDLECVEGFMGRLGTTPSRARSTAVRVGERLGRLKLNGRVVRPSPLAAVTELEGCLLLLESNRALWSGLAASALGPPDAAARAERALELQDAAEQRRLTALRRAIWTEVEPRQS